MSSPVSPPLTVSTVDGATVGRPITTLKVSNGTLTVSGNTAIITTGGGGGGSGTVTSVGLTETGSALTITGSPITTSGTINIAGAGTSSQVILGDLSLGTLTSGTVTGTGSANQVSYWTSSSVQAGSTGLTYDSSTGNLTVGGYVEVGTKITTPTGTDLTLDTVNGTDSGSIVISDGVDGQVSISANGSGVIKLGAANNPVTVSNVYTLPTAVTADNNYVLTAQTDGTTAWAASGGGGGIGGSGTVGTLPVFVTDTTTLGDSRLVQTTTDLTYSASGGTALNIKSSDGNEPNLRFQTSTSAGLYFQLTDADTITLKKIGSNFFRYRSSGTAFTIYDNTSSTDEIFSATYATGGIKISDAYTLPTVVTTDNDYVLTAQTDGTTAWAASGGGGGSPGGSDTELQYNDGGSFGGISSVTFNDTSNYLTIDPTRTIIGAGPAYDSGLTVTDVANFRNSQTKFADGTAAAPSITFWNNGDDDTGIYRPTLDTIGFTVGGNERMRIANNAIEGITFRVDGTDTAAAPGFSFDPDNDTGMFSVSANTLSFSTGGSERLRVGSSGEILIGGSAAGSSGQVLTSGGSGSAVTWADAPGTGAVTVGSYAGNNNVAYFSDTTEISNTNNISINAVAGSLDCFGEIEAGNVKIGTDTNKNTVETSSAQDLVLRTNGGTNSGSIVITDGVDGQISITPNGAGTIKLDGVELDNSAIATGYVLKATSATAAGWAAESGGSSGGLIPPQIGAMSFLGTYNRYTTCSTPFAVQGIETNEASTEYNSNPIARPFILPEGGTWGGIEIKVTSASSSNSMLVALYNSDSTTGNATSLVGYCDIDTTSTGNITQTTTLDSSGSSATITLSANTQYWVSIVANANSDSCSLRVTQHESLTSLGSSNTQNLVSVLRNTFVSNAIETTNPPRFTQGLAGRNFPVIAVIV